VIFSLFLLGKEGGVEHTTLLDVGVLRQVAWPCCSLFGFILSFWHFFVIFIFSLFLVDVAWWTCNYLNDGASGTCKKGVDADRRRDARLTG
jgi:hypothetical protein